VVLPVRGETGSKDKKEVGGPLSTGGFDKRGQGWYTKRLRFGERGGESRPAGGGKSVHEIYLKQCAKGGRVEADVASTRSRGDRSFSGRFPVSSGINGGSRLERTNQGVKTQGTCSFF